MYERISSISSAGFEPGTAFDAVKIPVHNLAYYFREENKQTFSDYRNEWRVEHAKNLIREGKSNDLTLEAKSIWIILIL
jgi:AraC-like DNA-binding protein